MKNEITMFQQLIFSILMRHKDELYGHLDKIILEQVNEVRVNEIIKKMFYEIKMPDLERKIQAFINNEFVSVIGRHVDEYSVELKVKNLLDKMVNEQTEKVLKEKYSPQTPHDDVLIGDFHIDSKEWHPSNWLSVRVVNCLKAEEVKTIGQLLGWCEHQLLKTPNLGKKSIAEIKLILARANLALATRPNTISSNGYDTQCYTCKTGRALR